MGLYDNFMLPSSGKYISTYAGKPIQELAALGETIGAAYEQGVGGVSAYNVMREQTQVSGADQAIKDEAFDSSYKKIKKFVEDGNYEDANPAIIQAATMVSGNKKLIEAMANNKSLGKHKELADKLLSTQKINKDQYNVMLRKLGEYGGVDSNGNINDNLYIPSKPINVYDKFYDAAKTVGKTKGTLKRVMDPVTKKMIDVTREQRNPNDVKAAIQAAQNDPEFRGYYRDLVEIHGQETANQMVMDDANAALKAATATSDDNKYIGISDGGGGNDKIINFGQTVSQKISPKGYNNISTKYSGLEEEYNRTLAKIEAVKASGAEPSPVLLKNLESIKKEKDKIGNRLDSMTSSLNTDFDYEKSWEDFKLHTNMNAKNMDNYFEEAGIEDYPQSLEEYKVYLDDKARGDISYTPDQAGASGYTKVLSPEEKILRQTNKQGSLLKKSIRDTVKKTGEVGSQGYLLTSESGGYIDKVNDLITDVYNRGGTGSFVTYEGDINLSAKLKNDKISMKPGSEELTMTTVYDDNGNNVYQLSYVDEASGTREAILIKSGSPILSKSNTTKVNSSMQQVAINPNATKEERLIADNYLSESLWTQEFRKEGVHSGAETTIPIKLPYDSRNPSKSGDITVSVERTGDIYTLKLTSPSGETKTHDYNGIPAISQALTIENNRMIKAQE